VAALALVRERGSDDDNLLGQAQSGAAALAGGAERPSLPMAATEVQQERRPEAVEFPMMLVISIIYPCNFGCPNCPYTDGNSEIRKFYHDRNGDLFPVELWKKIAVEAGPYKAWMRCTGGGEPMLHPLMVDMIEFAKAQGARIWLNTNGSMFGPSPKLPRSLNACSRPASTSSSSRWTRPTPRRTPCCARRAVAARATPRSGGTIT